MLRSRGETAWISLEPVTYGYRRAGAIPAEKPEEDFQERALWCPEMWLQYYMCRFTREKTKAAGDGITQFC